MSRAHNTDNASNACNANSSKHTNTNHTNHITTAHRAVPASPTTWVFNATVRDTGITTTGVEDAVCCYAEKTETWMQSPEGARWEWYVKSGDTDQMEHAAIGTSGVCCG